MAETKIANFRRQLAATLDVAKSLDKFEIYLPLRFQDKKLQNFDGHDDLVKLAVNAITQGRSVFLTGACGSGKTHLACALIREWLKQYLEVGCEWDTVQEYECGRARLKIEQPTVRFLPVTEFFVELKDAMDSHQSEGEILDSYTYRGLLVLDDLGAERLSDWSRQMIYTLIDRRYRNMAPIIITSNRSLKEISELIDDRIASRIVEMGEVIDLGATDWRLRS